MISVLYVDDQEDLLDIGKRFLERNGEIRTDTCSSPEIVLEIIKTKPYDAIISDYEMPGTDGLTLLKNIRGSGNTIPFIIFTGKGREEVVIEALNNGADYYLQKGGDPKSQFVELIHKVKLAVRRKRAEQEIAAQVHLVKRTADISTRLLITASDLLKPIIQESVGEICRLCRSDRCYLIQWDDAIRKSVSITHEWCADGVFGRFNLFQHQSADQFSCYIEILNKNQYIHIRSVSDGYNVHPDVRDHMIKYHIKSLLLIPLIFENSLMGALGLDAVEQETSWTEEEIDVLRIFGQAIINTIIRKTFVKELTESEARYRSVVESQTEFICRYRPDGIHQFVNEAYCRHFNLAREEIIGKRFTPVIPAEERQKLQQYFAALTPDHPHGFIEHRIILPDGSIKWHQWTDHALFDQNGTCIEYQSVGRDVTDRKNIEISFSKSEDLYRTVFESTGTAMMVLDDDMTILSMNREMERISGYSKADIEKKAPWTILAEPGDLERLVQYHKKRRSGDPDIPSQYEVTIITRDRRQIDSFITVGMIPGTKQSVVSIIRDF